MSVSAKGFEWLKKDSNGYSDLTYARYKQTQESSPPKSLWIQATRVFPSQEPVNPGYKSLPLPRACESRLQESSPLTSL